MPEIHGLRMLAQSLATLDAIIEREWGSRYYSFNSKWDVNEQMASMRDGEGDSWFLVFGQAGAFLKGFDHQSPMARASSNGVWPGVLDDVPEQFNSFVKEPAFSMQDTTFCIWRSLTDSNWNTGRIAFPQGEDPDGSESLLYIFDGDPTTYQQWAEGYYGQSIDFSAVQYIYAGKPLTESIVKLLNKDSDLADLSEDLIEIGYPVSPN